MYPRRRGTRLHLIADGALQAGCVVAWLNMDRRPELEAPVLPAPYALPVRADPAQTLGAAAPNPLAVADRKVALIARYKLRSVADGDASWTPDELDRAAEAFALIPPADRAALAGIDVVRVQAIGRDFSAEFAVAPGTSDPADPSAAFASATLVVANGAFGQKDGQVLPRDEQVRILVHEVGHAVAHKAQRDANAAVHAALVTANAAIAGFNATGGAANAAIEALQTRIAEYDVAADAYNRAQAMVSIDAHTDVPHDLPLKQAAMDAARQKVDDLQAQVRARRAVVVGAQTRLDVASRLQAGFSGPPKAVLRFVALVEAYGIPPLTPYAQQNWPFNPEEAFAEAYSIWRTRPAELRAEAGPLYDWFEAGRYRD